MGLAGVSSLRERQRRSLRPPDFLVLFPKEGRRSESRISAEVDRSDEDRRRAEAAAAAVARQERRSGGRRRRGIGDWLRAGHVVPAPGSQFRPARFPEVIGNSWAAHWRPSSARQRSRGEPVNSCPPRVRPSGRLRAIWCAAGRLVRTSPASRRKAREVGREPEHVGAPVVSALASKPRCGGDSPYKPCL